MCSTLVHLRAQNEFHTFVDMDRTVNDKQTWIIKLTAPCSNIDSRERALRLEGWALGYRPLGGAFIYSAPPGDYVPEQEEAQ